MASPTAYQPAESIAIIGMRGRFPGAPNLDQFWRNLREGVESISRFSPEELRPAWGDRAPEMLQAPGFVPAGAVLDDVGMFDANFFGFSARDAEMMDPQQRLFLECAYESLEDAGYDSETYPGLIGVFGGMDWSTYIYGIYSDMEKLGYVDGMSLAVGNDKDHLTTHVSYKLNLRGPSIVVQTACSTSLVAVCLGCQSLLSSQSDIALAGGVTVCLPQKKGYFYQAGGIVSPDGHCRTFDAAAQGTVIGNGVGIVVMKRLSEAIADGDHIHAVIKGSALNNDGAAKVGYTAPGVEGQAQVIAMAQALAGVDPETITYVEAHGTATALGDPIEVAALTQAFRLRTNANGFCAIGSLKSNVGHMSSAAGVGGLIKTVLALKHGELPPTLNFEQANPQIDFASSPFYVNSELQAWRTNGHPRRAGVSSFGIGGTNAHVVLEEAPPVGRSEPSRGKQLLVLSAKTEAAVEQALDNLAGHLEQNPSLELADVAYTLQVGRKAFNHRRVLVCENDGVVEAAVALRSRDPQRMLAGSRRGEERPIAFMFPGQGTQYVNMGLELYQHEPTFREQIDHCCELLKPRLGLDLRQLLYPERRPEEATEKLKQTEVTQPALFTIEYALATLLMEWGVTPSAMIGHSIGEYVAACLAGVLSLDDALGVVAVRGRLMAQMPPGAMLAVPLSEVEVQPLIAGGLSLAAVNAPALCVLSGPVGEIQVLEAQLAKRAVHARRLHTSHAFHSTLMDPVVGPFVQELQAIALQRPQIPFLSNVTGTWITEEAATNPSYWGRQLRQPVRFADGVQELARAADWIVVEVGPGQILSALARQGSGWAAEQIFLPAMRSAQDQQSDMTVMLGSLARLWVAGASVNWTGFSGHERRRRVPLPSYPFQKEHYWMGLSEQSSGTAGQEGERGQQLNVGDWFYVPSWKPALQEPLRGATGEQKPSRWLMFGSATEFDSRLRERLEEKGDVVTTVVAADRFVRVDPSTYELQPQLRTDYDALLKELRADGRVPDKILHLWSVGRGEQTHPDVDGFHDAQSRGFYSVLFLAQALERQNISQAVEIAVVSSGLHAVLGDEPLVPANGTILGACRVIPQEYSNLTVRSIDLAVDDLEGGARERTIDRLIAEITVEPFESTVAYRKGRRWVQGYEPVRLERGAEDSLRLRHGGVYLITGGLGSIGLTLAECLAETVQAKLVLTGRSSFPARSDWDRYVTTHGGDDVSRKIRTLLKLEDLGAEVLVARADAADRVQMQSVLDATLERFGALHGVIHGAGNTSAEAFSPVNQADEAVARSHFGPKADGLMVLEQLVRDRQLDFCLMLSSLSAVLGGLGLMPYAAANAFMDVFAARQNQTDGVPWISVNWDSWHFPAEGEAAPVAGLWTDAITPADGKDAFLRILHAAPSQVVVSTSDLRARLNTWINLASVREQQPVQAEVGPMHARPNLSTQFVAPRSTTEETIAVVWQQLLGVAPVGVYDRFFELGGHSLLAIQVVSRLREVFHVELPVQRLFEAPTIAQLAESIERDVDAAEQAARIEQERLAEMLRLVEQLSDSEVAERLAEHN